MAEALEHADHGLSGVGKEGVVVAGDEERDAQTFLLTLRVGGAARTHHLNATGRMA